MAPQSLLHKAGMGRLTAGGGSCLLPPLDALTGTPGQGHGQADELLALDSLCGFCRELCQRCELPLLYGFGSTWLHQRATW